MRKFAAIIATVTMLTALAPAVVSATGPPDGSGPWTSDAADPDYSGIGLLCVVGYHAMYNTATDSARCFKD